MTRKIKAVLIDLSGTLHIDNTVIPGAVEALNRYAFIYMRAVTRTYMYIYISNQKFYSIGTSLVLCDTYFKKRINHIKDVKYIDFT